MSSNNSGLMDTEPGGEQTQYEGEYTDVLPKKKLPGQFGGGSAADTSSKNDSKSTSTQGVSQPEKATTGAARFTGGNDKEKEDETADEAAQSRRAQGYGGEKDMDRTIGA